MNNKHEISDSKNAKNMAKTIVDEAKERNLIKHVSEAFKDVPVKDEAHKGNVKYFCD